MTLKMVLFRQCEDFGQVRVHCLDNCLPGDACVTTKAEMGNGDVLEAELMQTEKKPRHL